MLKLAYLWQHKAKYQGGTLLKVESRRSPADCIARVVLKCGESLTIHRKKSSIVHYRERPVSSLLPENICTGSHDCVAPDVFIVPLFTTHRCPVLSRFPQPLTFSGPPQAPMSVSYNQISLCFNTPIQPPSSKSQRQSST